MLDKQRGGMATPQNPTTEALSDGSVNPSGLHFALKRDIEPWPSSEGMISLVLELTCFSERSGTKPSIGSSTSKDPGNGK